MKTYQYQKIAIKIGSNVLTHKDGTLDVERMRKLVEQVALLHKAGLEVVLISSGAVAAGRSEMNLDKKLDPVSARQIFSAVGQAKLINWYYDLFREHGIRCGQVLTMKETFRSRQHYLNQKNCMTAMLAHGVIPIVNENDTISVTELMFTDNDELSGLIATMLDMDVLIILSNIDGIYDGNPSEEGSMVMREIHPNKDLRQYVQPGKSSFGRGGMLTKCNIARKVAEEGVPVIIANGEKDNILPDLLKVGSITICTKFIPNEKEVSSVKKWIAHSESFSKGEVWVKNEAANALSGKKATSLLFVGVTDVKGDFKKGDIVRIINEETKELCALGMAQCDSEKAYQNIGRKGIRPFITYEYLYVEQ